MNKVLEFVMYYVMYLVAWFLGLWVANLITEADINPFTSWVPYVLALIFSLQEVMLSKRKKEE